MPHRSWRADAADHEAGLKPSPYRVRIAVGSLQAEPEDCVFIGGTETDVLAGLLGGVAVIGYPNKLGNAETLRRARAPPWSPNSPRPLRHSATPTHGVAELIRTFRSRRRCCAAPGPALRPLPWKARPGARPDT